MKLNRNIVVAIDGLDGSGKTTQMEYLEYYFMENNITYNVLRVANSLTLNEDVKNDILPEGKTIVDNSIRNVKLGVFFLNEIYKYSLLIDKALKQDGEFKIILLDRWIYSTIIYNAYNTNLRQLIDYYIKNKIIRIPDLYFYIDLDVNMCIERITERAKNKEVPIDKLISPEQLKYTAYNHSMMKQYSDIYGTIDALKLIELAGKQPAKDIHAAIISYIARVNNECRK